MTQSVCILGRQPALGLAELESLYDAHKITPLGKQAALVDVDPCLLAFDRLGGAVKFCKLLTILDTTDWREIEKFLVSVAPKHAATMPDGKMQLGLSVIGLEVGLKQLQASGLILKKAIRQSGRSVRLIPNKSLELNTAQVLHNNLTGPTGWELYFIRSGQQTYVAQTVKIQDIEAYAARDQARPKRDARVGMLPPKLAQIIINLAVGKLTDDELQNICEVIPNQNVFGLDAAQGRNEARSEAYTEVRRASTGVSDKAMRQENQRVLSSAQKQAGSAKTVLDPFCGTGVVLQEALLMGYRAIGSDLEPRMVEYSDANLEWLCSRYQLATTDYQLSTADATSFDWQKNSTPNPTPSTLFIACETYLGRPFSASPKPEVLQEVMQDVDTIHRKFLKNLAKQTKPGFRACLAVPAWNINQGKAKSAKRGKTYQPSALNPQPSFLHLKTLDSLEELGYTRSVFKHVQSSELIYHRPGQIVGRELVVLTRA